MTDQNTSETAATNAFLKRSRPKLAELETIRLAKLKVFQFRKKIALPIGVVPVSYTHLTLPTTPYV